MAISDETEVRGGPVPLLAPPALDLAPAGAGEGRRGGSRRFAADLAAAASATGLALGCWSLCGPPAGTPTIVAFAVTSVALLTAVTGRTRTVSARIGELLGGHRAGFWAVSFDVALTTLTLLIAAWLDAFGSHLALLPIITLAAGALLLIPLSRGVARTAVKPLRVVLIGHGRGVGELCVRLAHGHAEVIMIPFGSTLAPAGPATVQRLCARHTADALLVVLSGPAALVSRADDRFAAPDVEMLLRMRRQLPVQVAIQRRAGTSPLLFRVGGDSERSFRALKRMLDVVISALALLVLAPLLAVLMLCIGLDSGFPLLFRQQRLGRGRESFDILKLRTMRRAPASPPARVDAEGTCTPLSRSADPMLVTRVGGLLRRTALDEVPQLINVLRGEMSLIGPRPFVPEECESLPGWAAPRFSTRPGMTGMWQVCGQHSVSVDELCWLDLFYVSCWSPSADLRILLLTPARLLRGSRRALRGSR